MRRLGMSAILVALAGAVPVVADAAPRGVSAPRPAASAARWGHRWQGRWNAGWRAPGGWGAYVRPVRGYMLPRYWINPTYYIANYPLYGLRQPPAGYGWSRYYDDAVLTDQYGRVYDVAPNVAWDRYEGGYDREERYYADDQPRRDNGVGGAIAGAVVGGVAGNVIAGPGDRAVGTVVGAGVGALAGAAIDKAEDEPRGRHRDGDRRRDHDRYADRDGERHDGDRRYGTTYGDGYRGTWRGTWEGADGSTYSGEYSGDWNGNIDPHAHWEHGYAYAPPAAAGGYYANGWYYPAPTVTTVTITPATTTTTVVEEVTYTRPHARKAYKGKRLYR